MLYIRKFYVVQNTYINLTIFIGGNTGTQLQWRVTNMVRNDLHARGGLGGGGAKRPHELGVGGGRPHQQIVYKNKLFVCLSAYDV